MSHYLSSSSSGSSPTIEEVQVEVHDEVYDPGEEMILCMLQLSRQIHEASQSNNKMQKIRRFIQRNREASHLRIINDYFSTNPVYLEHIFQRRFQMRTELFLRIVNALEARSSYFQLRNDAARRKRLSPLQKCTTAIRQLAYGVPFDHLDEYLRMGESTAINCLFKFCKNVVEFFGDRYLRRLNVDDIQCLLQMHEERHGFLACWVALMVCTGTGKIVQLLGKAAYKRPWVTDNRTCSGRVSRFVDMARILWGRRIT